MNVNFLSSQYERYHSFGVSSNVSMTYYSSKNNYTSTLLLKNIGRQLTSYANEREYLPFEIQLSKQTNFDTGDLEIKQETIAKTVLRHIVIGGELNPFRKSLFLRAGFNFQRRFDLSLKTAPVLVGFSWGLGFRVYNFQFDYSRSSYHLSAHPNNFNISTNISTFGI